HQGVGEGEVAAIGQLGGDAGGVVVAHEDQGPSAAVSLEETLVATDRMGELEQVRVADRGPGRLPQLVLGDRVRSGACGEGRIVAMDDLAQDPGLGVGGPYPLEDGAP